MRQTSTPHVAQRGAKGLRLARAVERIENPEARIVEVVESKEY